MFQKIRRDCWNSPVTGSHFTKVSGLGPATLGKMSSFACIFQRFCCHLLKLSITIFMKYRNNDFQKNRTKVLLEILKSAAYPVGFSCLYTSMGTQLWRPSAGNYTFLYTDTFYYKFTFLHLISFLLHPPRQPPPPSY